MGIGRSTFYDTPDARARELTIVAEMKTICDEFEAYGYRRVDAELRHRGIVVNAKKLRRLMREHALNPKQRRRFVATTDSDHNYPIFPNLAKNMKLDGPTQLWVADITYVTIATGFVYLAAILDAWSRRVVGRHQPLDRCTARCCCTQGRYQRPQSAKGLCASFRPWVAVCLRRLSRRLAKARSHRLHGPARQSLRQRQGRELHEDTQGRSRVSDGIRNLRGRYSRPSPLHRRGLQHPQTPLRARLSEPRAIRGSTRPATCQKSRLKLSTIKGALQLGVKTGQGTPTSAAAPLSAGRGGLHRTQLKKREKNKSDRKTFLLSLSLACLDQTTRQKINTNWSSVKNSVSGDLSWAVKPSAIRILSNKTLNHARRRRKL